MLQMHNSSIFNIYKLIFKKKHSKLNFKVQMHFKHKSKYKFFINFLSK